MCYFIVISNRHDYDTAGMLVIGALSGGVGAELTTGKFWQGAGQGFIVAALNHLGEKWFGASASQTKEIDEIANLSDSDLGFKFQVTRTKGLLLEEPNSIWYLNSDTGIARHNSGSITTTVGSDYFSVGYSVNDQGVMGYTSIASPAVGGWLPGIEIYYSAGYQGSSLASSFGVRWSAGNNIRVNNGINVDYSISPLYPIIAIPVMIYAPHLGPQITNFLQHLRLAPAFK